MTDTEMASSEIPLTNGNFPYSPSKIPFGPDDCRCYSDLTGSRVNMCIQNSLMPTHSRAISQGTLLLNSVDLGNSAVYNSETDGSKKSPRQKLNFGDFEDSPQNDKTDTSAGKNSPRCRINETEIGEIQNL